MAKYWIARDFGGLLYAYINEPKRMTKMFTGYDNYLITYQYHWIFKDVTWENSPIEIDTDD